MGTFARDRAGVRTARRALAGIGFGAALAYARIVQALPGEIVTFAGNGTAGYAGDGGDAGAAAVSTPQHIVLTGANDLYFADSGNHVVRKIDLTTNVITTIAGDGSPGFGGDGGPATAAKLFGPWSVAVDADGNVYVSDQGNRRVRRIDGSSGTISTIAGDGTYGTSGDGGLATAARLAQPTGLALDAAGRLYVADWDAVRVRRIDLATGVITNFAGSGAVGSGGDGGPATAAKLDHLTSVVVDSADDVYLVDDTFRIRRVDHASGVIDTVVGTGVPGYAGDGGLATAAQISHVFALAVDATDNLLLADSSNHRIRRVDRVSGIITTVAGNGTEGYSGDQGAATAASLDVPRGIAVDAQGDLFLADSFNHRLRRVTACTDDDADSVCATYDPCTNVAHAQDLAPASTLAFSRINVDPTSGNEKVRLRGKFALPASVRFSDLDLATEGARLLVRSASGQSLLDVTLAPGAYTPQTRIGWSGSPSRWKFVDSNGQLASGLTKMSLVDRSRGVTGGTVKISFTARRGTYAVVSGDQPVNAAIVLGGPSAAAGGRCAESRFMVADCRFNGAATSLKCRR